MGVFGVLQGRCSQFVGQRCTCYTVPRMKIKDLIRELNAGTHILITHDHEGRHYDGYLTRIERVTPSTWRIHYGRHIRTVSADSHIDAHIIRRYRA